MSGVCMIRMMVLGQSSNLASKDIIEDGRHWMVAYHENGNMSMKVQHEHGVFDGKAFEYHDNGKLKAVGSYSKGKLNDSWMYYYESGNKRGTCNYRVFPWGSGRVGTAYTYYENGNMEEEKNYLDGKASGAYKRYDEEGRLVVKGQYLDGWKEGEWLEFEADGKISMKGVYLKDMQDGEWTQFSGGKWTVKNTFSKGVFIKSVTNEAW